MGKKRAKKKATKRKKPAKKAKKSTKKVQEAPAKRKKSGYISPSYLEISCPRCGSPNTEPTGSKGAIQRRRCKSPTCRHPFKVARRRVLEK